MGYLCADLAFDFLRTKSTLGYLCFSKVIKVSDYYGFRHGSRENSTDPVDDSIFYTVYIGVPDKTLNFRVKVELFHILLLAREPLDTSVR